MDFDEILDQAIALLQRRGRLTYGALKRQFHLDDAYLADLVAELIDGQRLANDEDGKVLVWIGSPELSVQSPGAKTTPPIDPRPVHYTPPHLAERIQAEREAMEARGGSDGERKSITALFADIKGSTDLIADLDPEEARAILDPTLKLMMDAVHRYEGYVAQSLGDGIFALFGAPIAHEDHPQRALYAALLMQEESRKQAEHLRREKGMNLQIRVGINTGEVVLRSIRKDDLHTDYVPVGQSTHLASRMESLATPGSIVVSEQTYKLTEGYFEFKSLGQAQVKGFSEPLNIYEVAGVGPLRTKLQLSVKRGLARFVGRQNETAILQHALEQAKAGHGQIVGVMGEPGVGKSRLFYEFKLLSQRGCLLLETFSVSHGKAYPYLPLIDLLKNYFQLTNQDDERRRREKITGKVLTLDRSLEDILPYLFFLLGIAEATSPLQQMDGQVRRRRILEAMKRLLLRESLNQPLIIIFEDLHWLDAETQAFLQLLSESVATARIVLLVNYRPEYQATWHGKTYFAQLRLDPLGREQAAEMLATLLGEDATTTRSPLHQFILDKTEGNPFFMEEIVQTLREQGLLHDGRHSHTLQPTDLRIPTTVQGVLSARIDRLPAEEKSLLQTLAVLGREFSSTLLRNVVTQPEPELLALLARLQAGEFVYEQPAFPDTEYIFKHALTQEVAYNSLLIERRKVLHERTAQAIEEIYRVRLDDHYSELAYHYSRSGNTQKAIDYLQLAGQQAGQRSAYGEATQHLEAALSLLQGLPTTDRRTQQELSLQLALGAVLIATKGYGALEAEHAYTQARALCEQSGQSLQRGSALWGLWIGALVRAELETARQLGDELLRLGQEQQDQSLIMAAHGALGFTLFWLGEVEVAQAHLEQSISLYQHMATDPLVARFGQDTGVVSMAYSAWALWFLGYPDQARKRLRETLAITRSASHPFSLALPWWYVVCLYVSLHEWSSGKTQVEEEIRLCEEYGLIYWGALGTAVRGRILVAHGQNEDGIAQMLQGQAEYEHTRSALTRSYLLALLAEGEQQVGRIEQGFVAITEALMFADRTKEELYLAELYRLNGELTLRRESTEQGAGSAEQDAERCFLKALDISRKQQAKSLELRAATSLARLWQSQGKQHEAYQLLSAAYTWFTEGFDTQDLREAKALLDTLKVG